jgi:hypothetical protein
LTESENTKIDLMPQQICLDVTQLDLTQGDNAKIDLMPEGDNAKIDLMP